MGRHTEGWRLTWKASRRGPPIGHVRFTLNGQRVERSTEQTEKRKAIAAAEVIYANAVAGRAVPQRRVRKAIGGESLVDLTVAWLDQLPNPKATIDVYEGYARQWIVSFKTVHAIDTEGIEEFTRMRLKSVIRKTILKELSKLRGFLKWAKKFGFIHVLPVVPIPDATDKGVRSNPNRKIKEVALSEKEAKAILRNLPETGRKWRGRPSTPRAFFSVLWETGLRPSTVFRLEAGRHYFKGADELHITADIDKVKYERTVGLTPAAREALDSVCQKTGILFPRTDYRNLIRVAAAKAKLPPEKVAKISRYDFRHARTTDLVRATSNLLGTAQLVGHTQVSTTNRYLHPDREAGDAVIKRISGAGSKKRAPNSGAIVVQGSQKRTSDRNLDTP